MRVRSVVVALAAASWSALAVSPSFAAPDAGAPKPTPAPTSTAPPAALTAATIAANMEKVYVGKKSYDADFDQTYKTKVTGKKTEKSGHLALLRPDQMLFRYATPLADVTVSDGKTIKMYSVTDKTSLEGPVKKSAVPAAFAFLAGGPGLSTTHTVTSITPCADAYCLKAEPKTPTNQYSAVVYTLDASFEVQRAMVVDAQGNYNLFKLKNRVFDSPATTVALFQWSAPPGTTIKPLP